MNKLSTAKYFMMAAIFTIAAFQGYWLYKLYNEEYNNIQKQADVLLKQTVQNLQESSIKADSTFLKYIAPNAEQLNSDDEHKKLSENISLKKQTNKSNSKNKPLNNNEDSLQAIEDVKNYSSKTKTFRIVNPAINDSTFNFIKQISFGKDSNSSKKIVSIILNSKFSKRHDSLTKNIVINRNKDTSFSKSFTSKISFDSLKISEDDFKKMKSPVSFKPVKNDTSKFNFSNLIIKIFTDSIAPKKVDSVFKQTLAKEKVALPFKLVAKRVSKENTNIIDTSKKSLHTTPATVGLVNPIAYQAQFENPFWFIVKRMSLPIGMSILLLGFVSAAFIFLYKNMMAQKKLATMKTDFISNVTHELKTPIATVNVAIEALRNFNAIEDKKKSKDYLDISAMEINRLGLLVDNVLKLSMFENDKVELQKENFDVVLLANEVASVLSIIIDKKQACVSIEANPENIFIVADKLYITSVLFNLIDNALKYTTEKPAINIGLLQQNNIVKITVVDNGIGISKEHQQKIFNKFYRIQTGDRHNVKGYGLGLSYVNYIVKKHNGTIKVKSELGVGSEFVIEFRS